MLGLCVVCWRVCLLLFFLIFKTANGNPLKHKKPHKKTQQKPKPKNTPKRGNTHKPQRGQTKTHNQITQAQAHKETHEHPHTQESSKAHPHPHYHTQTSTRTHTKPTPPPSHAENARPQDPRDHDLACDYDSMSDDDRKKYGLNGYGEDRPVEYTSNSKKIIVSNEGLWNLPNDA